MYYINIMVFIESNKADYSEPIIERIKDLKIKNYMEFFSDADYQGSANFRQEFNEYDSTKVHTLEFMSKQMNITSIKNTTNRYIQLFHGTLNNPYSGSFIIFYGSVSDIRSYTDNTFFTGGHAIKKIHY